MEKVALGALARQGLNREPEDFVALENLVSHLILNSLRLDSNQETDTRL